MPEATLDLGSAKLWVLEDGTFITDAGTFLGGSRRARIKGAMHAVLVETGDELVLLDSGFGLEVPESLADSYELRREKNLLESIEETGHTPADITRVVLSHLDPDHVGWALNPPSFPNATVYAQQDALEEARNLPEGEERREVVPAADRGVEEGWLELQSGNEEIVPGIKVEVRPGHTAGHQIAWIGEGNDAALYTADLAPAKIWLNPDLISGADTDPRAARKNRIEVLNEAERRNAPVILYHEPRDFLVRVRRTEKGFEGVPITG